MVTSAIYNTSEEGRRYSRACPPYPIYPDRRFQLQSHHDIRASTMTERDHHDESKEPRKRIAVACGRCRKRKIRCSGDPGNGAPCSNCKNAGHEPCLFLRVSSQETTLRDGPSDFGYTMDTARTYQARGASSHNAISPYATDLATGDMMGYRGSSYPYSGSSSSNGGGKGYYSSVSGWGAGGFGEDSVDYGLNYSYPHISQDSVHMVPECRYGSSTKAHAYVDSEPSSYTYGNLVHRPAASHGLQTLSLSGMASTLTTPDRLPTIHRSANTYSNGQSGHYGSSKSSSVHSSDVGYTGLGSGFETPVTYGSTSSIPSTISGRSGHADASAYPSAHNVAGDSIYGSDHSSYRSIHDSDSYIYSDRLDGLRRDSHSSASGASAGSVLSNGQVYVPDTQSHAPAHGYSVSAAASATPTGSSRASAATHAQTAGHRRSGGNLRSA